MAPERHGRREEKSQHEGEDQRDHDGVGHENQILCREVAHLPDGAITI